jgi:glycolate oxidase iron-sulfur subunit
LLFGGCEALAEGGYLLTTALAVARELAAPLELVPETALCCGLALVEAGHPEPFAAHAARVRDGLGPRPVNLVFLAPGCARAVRERWPALPAGSVVEHITTWLARAMATRPDLAERPPLPIAVAWHDPCELARGLGETTAPRALLAAAVEEVREPVRSGADTSCCGAAGLLPRSLPEVAAAIAAQRRTEIGACGADPVTASPACARALEATDLVVLLARWLGLSRSQWRRPSSS